MASRTIRWRRNGSAHDNIYHLSPDERYPYCLTTYRLTEHHSGATPTRSVPVTAELQPEGFAEDAAGTRGRTRDRNLDWVTLSTARGEVETRALVTERLRPFAIDGRKIYQIGMVWHFGWSGYATGDIANALTAVVGEPNTSIHENKSLTCNLRRGRIDRSAPQTKPSITPVASTPSSIRGNAVTVHPRSLDYPEFDVVRRHPGRIGIDDRR